MKNIYIEVFYVFLIFSFLKQLTSVFVHIFLSSSLPSIWPVVSFYSKTFQILHDLYVLTTFFINLCFEFWLLMICTYILFFFVSFQIYFMEILFIFILRTPLDILRILFIPIHQWSLEWIPLLSFLCLERLETLHVFCFLMWNALDFADCFYPMMMSI